ncbi:nitroreductase [bacterium]|nr:nitroreductase [bacterium]
MENPVIDLLWKRRATRSIDTEALPMGVMEEILEAARLAPSCYNKQPWRFLFIHSDKALEKGRKSLTGGNTKWANRAPLLIVGSSHPDSDCKPKDGREYDKFDTGMAVMNIMLAATHLGLVARPMAGWDPQVIREEFGEQIGKNEPVVMLAVGKPGDDESHVPDSYKGIEDKPRTRKAADEIATFL